MTEHSNIPVQPLYDEFVIPSYGRMPLTLVRGEGAYVWDDQDKKYLDFGAGIAVTSIGHSHPDFLQAISAQASKLVHASNIYYTEPQAFLARKLTELVGAPGKNFFCNSGAEANEGLIKLARIFGNTCDGGGRHGVITFEGSFHGRTMAGISATGQEKVKAGFAPLLEGFTTVPFNDLQAVRAAITDTTAAILVEPIQGEGGIRLATPEFLKGLQRLCCEHNLLLLFDEVQCGLGRTGDWCGWKSLMDEEIIPDGISWAKGIAGGFPLGAFWVRNRPVRRKDGSEAALCDVLGPGTHGTTYGGGPLGCTVASAVLNVVERDGLLENARARGEEIRAMVNELQSPLISGVRGVGMLVGIQLVQDFAEITGQSEWNPALTVVRALAENGMLAIVSGTHVVRLLPPLNVTSAQVAEARGILENTLAALTPATVG